jgi:hypothetical protein
MCQRLFEPGSPLYPLTRSGLGLFLLADSVKAPTKTWRSRIIW